MSNLVVLVFDEQDEAAQVRETLSSIKQAGRISLDDSAIVEKDADGKVHIKNELDRGVKIGALGGSLIGLLIGSVFFPIAGLVLGALGGGLVGASANMGISHKFVKQVADQLQPGGSALFVIVRDADPTVTLAALREYSGTVYQTTLDQESEDQLRRALEKKS